jgi:hypothetical protein
LLDGARGWILGATVRRILVAGSSIVVLALAGFLAVGVGARTVGHLAGKPVAAAHLRRALPVQRRAFTLALPALEHKLLGRQP